MADTKKIIRNVQDSRCLTVKERITAETGLNIEDAYWSTNGVIIKRHPGASTIEDSIGHISRSFGGLKVEHVFGDKFEIIGY